MYWILDHVLRGSGFVCEKALNEATTLMKRQQFRMAFLDVKLPNVDGLELARRIRRLNPSLPIIIVSGYFYHEDAMIQAAEESGLISAFISKPLEHHEMLRAVKLHSTE